MLFMLLTFILAWICAVILRYSLWRNECSKRMPGEKPRLFDILGDVKDLIVFHAPSGSNMIQKNFQDQFRRRTEKYKKQKLFCLWVTYVPFVVIFKHEAVKELMEKKIIEKNFTYKWMEPVIGTGLLSSEVSKWRKRRKLLMPCFSSGILRGFYPVFNERSQKLVNFLQEETKKEFTYKETPVTLAALDIICDKSSFYSI
ncbi:cytochrome P450 4V2-like isoform X3 [Argiope bruennichi]|uniref:cytochrome P450 4V2-like isoform X3 n=1 Tax=Argiope bruennichi TaxID=94029 RepID=UPI002493EA32|nr:cytochrome P450 4V2-like isoform X3 [Argiope bruennichi]